MSGTTTEWQASVIRGQSSRAGLGASGSRRRSASQHCSTRGFTLLEVVLALSIAFGLLVVVLYFYQQATRLRDSTLEASTGLAAVRLCMDRLATELRSASPMPGTFRGGSQEIEFQHCELPDPGSVPTATVSGPAAVLLRQVRYAMGSADGVRSGGALVRTEDLIQPAPTSSPESTLDLPPQLPDDLAVTNEVLALEPEAVDEEPTRVTTTLGGSNTAMLAVPEVRFLRLRYFDGSSWQESWSGSGLPRGVEVTLALEAPADDPEALPAEVFRRVIALPAGTAVAPAEVEGNLSGFPEVARHLQPE